MKKLILFLFPVLLFSCEKEQELLFQNSDELIGSWTNQVVNDTIMEFTKADSLVIKKVGIYGFVRNDSVL